ncbi:hypothetical protein H632_c850p0, partial [Helicosporidium sp. ATCC 50920]
MPRGRCTGNSPPVCIVPYLSSFSDDDGDGQPPSLSTLFAPPKGLMFRGSLDAAKAEACRKEVWLILNLQNPSEFASHRLNRDTWGDAMVRDLVASNFVCSQFVATGEEGQRLASAYKVYDLPAILVLDPFTGALMKQWTGFMSPDRLAEELMPFLDHGVLDPAASRLAAASKRTRPSFA